MRSVFQIHTENKEGTNLLKGSAFFICKNGKAITAAHLVLKQSVKRARFQNEIVPFEVVSVNTEKNLALLQLNQKTLSQLKSKPSSSSSSSWFLDLDPVRIPERGEVVSVVDVFSNRVSKGRITGFTEENMIQFYAQIDGGTGGSPLFDSKGFVIGIVTSGLNHCQGINFAVGVCKQNLFLVERVCQVCLKEAKTRCAKCHRSWYCSRDCQKIDWKAHKELLHTEVWYGWWRNGDQKGQAVYEKFGKPGEKITVSLVTKTDTPRHGHTCLGKLGRFLYSLEDPEKRSMHTLSWVSFGEEFWPKGLSSHELF